LSATSPPSTRSCTMDCIMVRCSSTAPGQVKQRQPHGATARATRPPRRHLCAHRAQQRRQFARTTSSTQTTARRGRRANAAPMPWHM
jgi:hypothetical protein